MRNAWNNRYPIALDLSDGREMRALQLRDRAGAPTLRAAARRTGDDGAGDGLSDAAIVAFLHDVRRDGAFRGRSVSLLAPPGTVLSYPLRVTVARGETFEAALVREAAQVLEFPIEDALLDYASISELPAGGNGAQQMLLMAARRRDADRYHDLVRQAGGTLDVIESAATALCRLHALSAPLAARPALLCAMGAWRTELVVATAEAILAHRCLNWGTGHLGAKLARNLDLSEPGRDADFLLRQYGVAHAMQAADDVADTTDGNARAVSQLVLPLVDACVHEFHNLTGYIRSMVPNVAFGSLFLYGDGVRVNGLCDYLARQINVDARPMHPMATLAAGSPGGVVDEAAGDALALTLGLALRRVQWL